MDACTFVVMWHNRALISIDIPPKQHMLIEDILNRYAEKYAFDRKELSGYFLDRIEWKEFSAPYEGWMPTK